MIKKLDKVIAGTQITDELHSNVGNSAFAIYHDTFFNGADLVIRTAASGGGTLLVENTDYTVSGIDSDLTTECGKDVYTLITITNITYQTGNLYFTYKAVADYANAATINFMLPLDGWVQVQQTVSYISGTSVKITGGNFTSLIKKGYGIKFDQGGVTKYFYEVGTPTLSSGNTTLTVSPGNDISNNVVAVTNSAITNCYFTPFPAMADSFPGVFNMPTITYTTSGTAFTNTPTTNNAYFWMIGGKFFVNLRFTTHATSGGTGTIYASLTGLPAPTDSNNTCLTAIRPNSSESLYTRYSNTNTRFEINKFDGTTSIGNSIIHTISGFWII